MKLFFVFAEDIAEVGRKYGAEEPYPEAIQLVGPDALGIFFTCFMYMTRHHVPVH